MSELLDNGTESAAEITHEPIYTLEAVPAIRLKEIWPSIREEVASIEQPDNGIPEEIYAMCFTNGATLFRLMKDREQVGYMIARLIAPDLHIWQVSASQGYAVLTTFRPQLMKLARESGARALTFGSSRRAWQKVAEQHGFKPRMVVYECPVE